MDTKKVSTPKTADNGKTTPKTDLMVVKELTNEELQKKVDELQKKLSNIPTNLIERTEYFKQKNEAIRRLSRLETNKGLLLEHVDNLAELSAADEYENEEYFLNIESGTKYSKTACYTLKNPIVIAEMMNFIIGRIDSKIEGLKKEIEA